MARIGLVARDMDVAGGRLDLALPFQHLAVAVDQQQVGGRISDQCTP